MLQLVRVLGTAGLLTNHARVIRSGIVVPRQDRLLRRVLSVFQDLREVCIACVLGRRVIVVVGEELVLRRDRIVIRLVVIFPLISPRHRILR